MSVRTSRWILVLGFVLLCPLPVFVGAVDGLMPVARMIMLFGVCAAIMLLENTNGVVGILAALLLAQAVVYAALLWLLAILASSFLGRFSRRALATVTLVLLVAGVAIATSFDPYYTPFHIESTRTGLLGIFR